MSEDRDQSTLLCAMVTRTEARTAAGRFLKQEKHAGNEKQNQISSQSMSSLQGSKKPDQKLLTAHNFLRE
jgi:hypothetical protein